MEVFPRSAFDHIRRGVYRLNYGGDRETVSALDFKFDASEDFKGKTPFIVQVQGLLVRSCRDQPIDAQADVLLRATSFSRRYWPDVEIWFIKNCDNLDISNGKMVNVATDWKLTILHRTTQGCFSM